MSEGVVIEDIEFIRVDGMPLLGRLYVPDGVTDFPALVDVHGGAWGSNDRLTNASMDMVLARAGIGVFALDFRRAAEAPYPASVADVNAGIRWLKTNIGRWGGNAKVGGLGTSSGGHLLLLNALRPNDPRFANLSLPAPAEIDASLAFAIACWPISDPVARYAMAQASGNARLVEAHHTYFGAAGAFAEASPQAILDGGEAVALPPTLLLQGTSDSNVTPDMATRFVAAFKKAGGDITLEVFEGQPHGFTLLDPASAATRRAMQAIVDFIGAQRGGSGAEPRVAA